MVNDVTSAFEAKDLAEAMLAVRCHGDGGMFGRWPAAPGGSPNSCHSVIAALEPGRTSWTAVLDAIRLGPDDDEAEVTASQVRDVITRLGRGRALARRGTRPSW
jgi:hypothetical protein